MKKAIYGSALIGILPLSAAIAQGIDTPNWRDKITPFDRVAPLTSTFHLNYDTLNYSTNGVIDLGASHSEDLGESFYFSGTYAINRTIREGIEGGVYKREQRGFYLQGRNIVSESTLNLSLIDPITLAGYKLQMSLIGDCPPEGEQEGTCTYTPAFATDPAMFDSETMLPTGFVIGNSPGDVITSETSAAIRGEGWQRGVSGGSEIIGVDLDIPNSGSFFANDRANEQRFSRSRTEEYRNIFSISKVNQNLFSNSSQASLDRTIRSFVFLDEDEWSDEAITLQLVSLLLPSFSAELKYDGNPNLDLGNNLFLAANNQWVPKDSFSTFEAGIGHISHAPNADNSPAVSWYNGVWLGFSPVTITTNSLSRRFNTTGERYTTSGPHYYEGDSSIPDTSPLGEIVVIDELTDVVTVVDSASVVDPYYQFGLEMTGQAALEHVRYLEKSVTSLVPNIVFGGNRTTFETVFRYYAGVLLTPDRDYYIGSDYNYIGANGVKATIAAEYHTDSTSSLPNFIRATASKTVQTAGYGAFTFRGGLSYTASKLSDASYTDVDRTSGKTLTLGLSHSLPSSFTYGASYLIGEDENDVTQEQTSIFASYAFSPAFSVNGQYTFADENRSYMQSSLGMSWAPAANTSLSASYQRNEYVYTGISKGDPIKTNDDVFNLSFNRRF